MSDYEPLREPGYTPPVPLSVDAELAVTRRIIEEVASLNIHSHLDMVKAATALDCRVRALVAALDAERGERS
ncbi:hypothetical protein ACGFZR_24695 [Streptomyces sp. NPDC048241]|uniref:hypothetical protein n=1 Tax=Streptomyces sp. NPDC048241 TaxID=3365521 RepID=UPI00371E817C